MDVFAALPGAGRILSLDIGAKRVGAAISDELQISVRPLELIRRTSWKKLLIRVQEIIQMFDAQAVVLGLPLSMDGTEGDACSDIRRLYDNFRASLSVPVFLQDERLTSRSAEESLRAQGVAADEIPQKVDGVAAVIILEDFLSMREERVRALSNLDQTH